MTAVSGSAVEEAVERLCHKGCKAVWQDIQCLEQGLPLPETARLSLEEAALVLEELKHIMAVYEGSCTPD
jgi:hypothetical protein